MIGSIIGDIVGSIYEFSNIRTKDFEFFGRYVEYTDDSILTLATADAILAGRLSLVADYYVRYAEAYPSPMGGYGNCFQNWVIQKTRTGYAPAYNSCGNGSAMRVGPVGWAFDTKNDTMNAAKVSAEGTHNHPEGIKGAQATAMCIFLARKGASKDEIQQCMEQEFGYRFPLTIAELQNVIPGMELIGKAMAASVRTAFRKPFNVRCRLRILKMLSVMPSVSVAIPIPSAASPVPLLKLFMGCLRTCVKKR